MKPSCYASHPNVVAQAENDCGRCPVNGDCLTEDITLKYFVNEVTKPKKDLPNYQSEMMDTFVKTSHKIEKLPKEYRIRLVKALEILYGS